MEFAWGAVIAAFVGSTGVVGLVGVVAQNTRTRRLRGAMESHSSILRDPHLPPRVAASIRAAQALDGYRLAAIALVPWRPRVLTVGLAILATSIAGLLVSILRAAGMISSTEIAYLYLAIVYLTGLATTVVAQNISVQAQRDRVVSLLLSDDAVRVIARPDARYEIRVDWYEKPMVKAEG